jgi:hypothetical protein
MTFFMIRVSTCIGPFGVLDVGRFSVLAQVEIAAHFGPGLRLAQVGGVTVDIESHVTAMKCDRCIWMGRSVVEKLDGRIPCVYSALCMG